MRLTLITALFLLAPTPAAAKDAPPPAQPASQGQTPPSPASTPNATPSGQPNSASSGDPVWAFDTSDVPVDQAFRFGRLENGMRYIIRHNATPAGTGLVRLSVDVGSLDEAPHEQGFAHFVEHMAFNGSKRVPEGQMIPLLEREGLAFGADTNASTNFDRTIYKLDLPRNDAKLLDTSLMLMRETASNLTISQTAVERERGVVLSEMRDRNSWQMRNAMSSTQFFYPDALYSKRFPIGTTEALNAATAQSLRAFYEREYVPAHITLIVIGDFDVDAVESDIKRHFADWQSKPVAPRPDAGPINPKDRSRTQIYLDPALSERITIQRNGKWLGEKDSIAQRREGLLRTVGYDMLNRRLQRLSRTAEPPYRGAGFGTGDVFQVARSTRLIIDSVDGQWQAGIAAAGREYRRSLTYGFTQAEVDEQIARLRTSLVNAVGATDTRSNAVFAGLALSLVADEQVPTTPQSGLDRFEAMIADITPKNVRAAMKREALSLDKPLIRFQGRTAPQGGETALRRAWGDVMQAKIAPNVKVDTAAFAYTDFGTPGQIISDTRLPGLGIREVRFANGVMLNLKQTALESDRIRLNLSVDGGDMLNTRDKPLMTEMVPYLDKGGLVLHSRDELDSILAGRTAGLGFSRGEATFASAAVTTPRDLELQLQLFTALMTAPGYRAEGEVQYRQQINTYFAQSHATPASALQADLGGILSDNDPRFSLQKPDDYRRLTYEDLRTGMGERLAHGAIELGVVGDIDEDKTIALVAATLGVLPKREVAFRDYSTQQPPRTFTTDRRQRVIRHTGAADQATVRFVWPTRDNRDPEEALKLDLLERVMRVELTDQIREALGKAYSPSASSALSREWAGYGVFTAQASVDVNEVPVTRDAILQVVKELRKQPVSDDILLRARQPLIESLQNALKNNGGWLALTARAQSQPDRIARFEQSKARILAMTPADIQSMAQRYLAPASAIEVLVLPEGVAVP